MSANETATQNDTKVDTSSQVLEPQKEYKTGAEVALLALSGRPHILELDDVWRENARSLKPKDYRVEDLLATMIYYTHGVEGHQTAPNPEIGNKQALLLRCSNAGDPR